MKIQLKITLDYDDAIRMHWVNDSDAYPMSKEDFAKVVRQILSDHITDWYSGHYPLRSHKIEVLD